jgi:phage terminase small subunit
MTKGRISFAAFFIAITQAAIRAGYSKKTAEQSGY